MRPSAAILAADEFASDLPPHILLLQNLLDAGGRFWQGEVSNGPGLNHGSLFCCHRFLASPALPVGVRCALPTWNKPTADPWRRGELPPVRRGDRGSQHPRQWRVVLP